MRRALSFVAVLVATGLGAVACTTPVDEPMNFNFGRAVASLDSQIAPHPVDPRPPEDSAARAALAVRRMETDQVKDPPGAYTSQVSSQTSTTTANTSGVSQ